MKDSELYELYDKISEVFWHYQSYHCTYVTKNPMIWGDGTLTFDVYGCSDQGYGSEWIENWGIRADGSIWSEDETYKDFTDFEQNWR
jgi:hypothetical protein